MDQLSSTQNKILDYIEKNTYTDRATAFRLFSVTSDYSIDQLLIAGYLKEIPPCTPDELNWYTLSDKGHAYLEEFNSIKTTEHKRNRMESLRFWIPVAIDTILSVAAIVISIIALLWQ